MIQGMKAFTILLLITFVGLVKHAYSMPMYEQSSLIDEVRSESNKIRDFNYQVIIIQIRFLEVNFFNDLRLFQQIASH